MSRSESYINDSEAKEQVIQDPTDFERYEIAPPRRTVEISDGMHLPVVSYGDVHL